MTDGLSAPDTACGKLQREILKLLRAHEHDRMLPTSARFIFYELIQAGVVPKARTGKRRADQNTIDALTHLREVGLVRWDAIEDETRSLDEFITATTVAEYVADRVKGASIDRWAGKPAPLILCESRSLAGALRGLAATYACPIASTNGQCRGFLITKVAPALQAGQRVLYIGDWDRCGHQIEAATRRTLIGHGDDWSDFDDEVDEDDDDYDPDLWERVALTTQQVDRFGLRPLVIRKLDRRHRPPRYFDAVETEALGQARIVAVVRARLDELMPEPIADVRERQRRQREQVAEQLRRMSEPEESNDGNN
jgi:hypothetical protein